jgi:hypothetical protein
MRKTLARSLAVLALLTLLSGMLAACGAGPGGSPGSLAATPTPTSTPDPSGFQGIASRACLLGDWPTMQTNRPSGDLLAWQPRVAGGSAIDRLAYLAPDVRSSWYTGVLMIADGPDFQNRRELAPNILATGDLTWSPTGDYLAFLAFRPDENVYTVMVVAADGSGLEDLFPTDSARTDARTSQKAIAGWSGSRTLTVIASCGEECRVAYDITVGGPTYPALTPTPMDSYRSLAQNLEMNRLAITATAQPLPKNLYSPNWSPDLQWIAYLDRRDLLWALHIPEKIYYLIDIGLRSVSETRWSPNSDHLAIRAEDRTFVFRVDCAAHKAP